MNKTKGRDIFISHIHEDDSELPKMKKLLEKNGMNVRDGSINSSKPNNAKSDAYIKSQILSPRINWASTLVVLISEDTAKSTYVNWEIEYAARQGKNIVGVYANGASGAQIPEALDKYGDAAIVGWRGGKLADAIEGKTPSWDRSQLPGASATPWTIERWSCA